MKNFTKLIGIIALAAVIGFLTTACDDGGNGGASAFLGDILELSGQVYLEEYKETSIGYSVSYQKYGGNLTIPGNLNYGGTGKVENGILTYSIGIPTSFLETLDFEDLINSERYDNFISSRQNVQRVVLSSLETNNHDYPSLSRSNYILNYSTNNMSESGEWVYYVYVNNDVTIKGKGKTETEDGYTYTNSYTTRDINLELKTGWNAVYNKYVSTGTRTGTNVKYNTTVAISLSNPSSLKWVTWENDKK